MKNLASRFWFLFMISFFFLPSLSVATPWSEIEKEKVLQLKEDLVVAPDVTLPKGSQFAVNGTSFFGPPFFEIIQLRLFPCPEKWADRKLELMILSDRYGFEMDWNCGISFYLEVRDYYSESYFEQLP